MTVLPIVIAPDPFLKKVSKPVEKIDDDLRKFMDDMLHTMYSENGLGLAAVQVGVLKRVVVMDVNYEVEEHQHHQHDHRGCDGVHVKNTNPIYFINPEIVKASEDLSDYNEGCLSFPDMRAMVTRPEGVMVKFIDYNGKEQTMNLHGIMATCIQHEIDHLNGVTFVDHISRLKRDVILKKMKKLQSHK
jgi:peptide deformylase